MQVFFVDFLTQQKRLLLLITISVHTHALRLFSLLNKASHNTYYYDYIIELIISWTIASD